MALIKCVECGTDVSDRAVSCPSCGCPVAAVASPTQVQSASPPVAAPAVTITKSRGLHIILGLVLGSAGFHNFYSGHYGRGAVKFALATLGLLLDLSTGFYSGFWLVFSAITQLWALVEIIVVKTDATGRSMT